MKIKPRGIFITGTDTGVGKTIISALVIRTLMHQGLRVGAMKPIETGCALENGVLTPQDGTFLRDIAQMDDSLDLITPLRFQHPLAPMVASEMEDILIDLTKVMDAYRVLSGRYDFMIVEGAGGLMVPIAKTQGVYLMLDLIKDLDLPLLIVARPNLGTINHILLTLDRAQYEGIKVKGIILNHSTPPDQGIAEKTNPEALKRLCEVPVLGPVPFLEDNPAAHIEEAAITIGPELCEVLKEV